MYRLPLRVLAAGILSTPLLSLAAELPYRDPALPVEQRVSDLLSRMTLDEKLGQMLMGARDWVGPEQMKKLNMGTLLSGGGSVPRPNTVNGWVAMMKGYQDAARSTRLGIPVLYGIDSTHGFAHLPGATVFPQLVGMAATRDEALVRRAGEITAREMSAAALYWTFGPMVSVVDDIRWGRSYEAFGENTELVSRLGAAFTEGFQGGLKVYGPKAVRPIATAKHFIGDGGVAFGSSDFAMAGGRSKLDRGDTRGDNAALLARHLPPYKAQVDAGVRSVMASFSSWNGTPMHANPHLLNDVLRKQLGFTGLIVSDWEAVQLLPGSFDTQVATATNAGIDVLMEPQKTAEVLAALRKGVTDKLIPQQRIDQAVSNILRVKFEMGLFEHAGPVEAAQAGVGSAEHRQVARELVRKSLVLLKNDAALPLKRKQHILVAGEHADDLGLQSGGWTLEWQGFFDNNTRLPGATTIIDGLSNVGGASTKIDFDPNGQFAKKVASVANPADVAIVAIGERPYSEWLGDRSAAELSLSADDLALIARMRPLARKLVLVLVSGRPLILGDALKKSDAVVAAWLPGSEGAGVADVLFGDAPFTGKLPYAWPKDAASFKAASAPADERRASLLFEVGYGLAK